MKPHESEKIEEFNQAFEDMKRFFENQPHWELITKRTWGDVNINIQAVLKGHTTKSITVRLKK